MLVALLTLNLCATQACADKLTYEMEVFGYPPKFPDAEYKSDEIGVEVVDPTKRAKKVKSKVATKEANAVYQWNIMRGLGLTDEQIKQFSDPHHWLKYFPPLAKSDLMALGCRV